MILFFLHRKDRYNIPIMVCFGAKSMHKFKKNVQFFTCLLLL